MFSSANTVDDSQMNGVSVDHNHEESDLLNIPVLEATYPLNSLDLEVNDPLNNHEF